MIILNKEKLRKLISNYIAAFDYINESPQMEYYKWEAVKHFQTHWDIDAVDFASMFKESVKKTYNLINNKFVQPTNFIVKLAENPKLTETVRQMFRDLFSDDGGDIDKRQMKIYSFMEKSDTLLNTYFKGSWKYAQDMRTVIFYLCLSRPDQNYIFKSTQAKEFMYCIEYDKDFGSGENFNLKNYYQMCNELVDEIKNTPKLIELHNSRLNKSMCSNDDYHILAYDIIYCAVVYNLYKDIDITKPTRSRTQSKEKLLQGKIIELNETLDSTCLKLNEALQERAEYDDFSAKGLEVSHSSFGYGVVINHTGNLLTVQFDTQTKLFQMPQGFSNGYLKTQSCEIMEIFSKIAFLDDKIKQLKRLKTLTKQKISALKN